MTRANCERDLARFVFPHVDAPRPLTSLVLPFFPWPEEYYSLLPYEARYTGINANSR